MPIFIERDTAGIVTVWLDNATKRNAMDDAMLADLASLLEQASSDHDIRALVIRGRHGCFCSGRDLGELPSNGKNAAEPAQTRLQPINRLARAFRSCGVPVVAVVEGKAAGLGVSLVCWSDITLTTSNASFSIPETRAGIAPSVTAVSLVEAVGKRHAVDLCLTGRSIEAGEALSIGLAQHLCDPENVGSMLEDLISSLTKGAPLAQRLTKTLTHRLVGLDFEASLAAANETAVHSFCSKELEEGLLARRERRAPAWQAHADRLTQATKISN